MELEKKKELLTGSHEKEKKYLITNIRKSHLLLYSH